MWTKWNKFKKYKFICFIKQTNNDTEKLENIYNHGINLIRLKFIPLPHLRINGTPSQRSFLMYAMHVLKVGVTDPLGTVGSSRYPTLASPSPSELPIYWPKTTFFSSMAGMERKTLTYGRIHTVQRQNKIKEEEDENLEHEKAENIYCGD